MKALHAASGDRYRKEVNFPRLTRLLQSGVGWRKKRKRFLMVVIDHQVPTPDCDAGSRSTWHYIQLFLKMGMEVKFIADNFQTPEPYTTQLRELGVEVLSDGGNHAAMQQWLVEHRADVRCIFTNRPSTTKHYLEAFRGMHQTTILYYGHDLAFVRIQRRFALSGDPADAKSAVTVEKLEMKIWQQADAVYYPSTTETDIVLTRLPHVRARTLPLFLLEPQDIRYEENLAQRRDLIFVGAFGHHPNRDAVTWFLDHCWPVIEKALPGVCFYIVGRDRTDAMQQRASDRVIVTGWLSEDDLTALYRRSRMAVVPLRYGAGVKGKVVEAMHHHLPVVMTTISGEGLPNIAGIALFADAPNAFAQSVIDLYSDETRLIQLGNAGGEYVARHFSPERAWKVIFQDIPHDL
ncbi:MAG: glycosyltransferase family 4 protein [Chthoniobacterales bacterium]